MAVMRGTAVKTNERSSMITALACRAGCCAALSFICDMSVSAYDVETHADISSAAAALSVLADFDVLHRVGLESRPINDVRQAFPSSEGGIPRSIVDLLRFGAEWEDNLGIAQHWFQPLRHFYDPVFDRGLDVGGFVGAS